MPDTKKLILITNKIINTSKFIAASNSTIKAYLNSNASVIIARELKERSKYRKLIFDKAISAKNTLLILLLNLNVDILEI
jgi:hypothetical protein